MSKKVVMVSMDDTLAVIRDIFNKANFHHLLVVENKKLVGIISDRDYLKSVNATLGTPIENARDLAALNLKAHQIMSRHVIARNENDSLSDVIKTFNEKGVSCVPIVNNHQMPVGIITWKDIIRFLAIKVSTMG